MKKSRGGKKSIMKGCSRKNNKYLGGSSYVNLAFPNDVPSVNNPHLAFTGQTANLARAYPAKGLDPAGFNFIVPQLGGSKTKKILGGSKHRKLCKCSTCKKSIHKRQKGGSCSSNGGLPVPNGLLGSPWSSNISDWPGVDGISMNRNHLAQNTYENDVSRQMLDVGANPPFNYFGGRRRKHSTKKRKLKNKTKKHRRRMKGRKGHKGGGFNNFLAQDLVNVGRQIPYGIGSTYNAFRGYQSPVSPLPWKDQMTGSSVGLGPTEM